MDGSVIRFHGPIGNFLHLNGGEKFPARYDRRHDMSIVANYDPGKKWKFGAVFVYGTGDATTLPERFYIIEGVLTQEYSKVNQYRLEPIIVLIFRLPILLFQKKKEKYKAAGCLVFIMFIAATIHILFTSIKPAVLMMAH